MVYGELFLVVSNFVSIMELQFSDGNCYLLGWLALWSYYSPFQGNSQHFGFLLLSLGSTYTKHDINTYTPDTLSNVITCIVSVLNIRQTFNIKCWCYIHRLIMSINVISLLLLAGPQDQNLTLDDSNLLSCSIWHCLGFIW